MHFTTLHLTPFESFGNWASEGEERKRKQLYEVILHLRFVRSHFKVSLLDSGLVLITPMTQ